MKKVYRKLIQFLSTPRIFAAPLPSILAGFPAQVTGSTFIYQNRTPFIRHCSLTSGVRFTFTGDYRKDQVRLILSIRSSSSLVKDIPLFLCLTCGADLKHKTTLRLTFFDD